MSGDLTPNSNQQFRPLRPCRSYAKCLEAGTCCDAWHCSSLRDKCEHRGIDVDGTCFYCGKHVRGKNE